MTIHSDFWRERRQAVTGASIRWTRRDSNRKRCYAWEQKHLRPVSAKFTDRQAAKGFARLCAKVAIRQMEATGLIRDDQTRERVRASFKAAFTKESVSFCDGAAGGVYFASWGWTDVIIAHEVAHWADQWAHKLGGRLHDYEPHGPRWRGWFAFILGKVGMRAHSPFESDARALAVTTLSAERLAFIMPE